MYFETLGEKDYNVEIYINGGRIVFLKACFQNPLKYAKL